MVDVSNIAKMNWHGKWIWANYITPRRIAYADRPAEYNSQLKKDEMNVYVFARRKFEVKSGLKKAIINITADSRYKLFINGKYIGRGINRCEAYYWYYNTWDITKYVKPGANLIAIHGRFYGIDFAYYNPPELVGRNLESSGKGGILFEVELNYGEKSEWIGSDKENTKIIRNSGERSDVPLKNDALGYIEECDSRKIPQNWNELNFDDSAWEKPIVLNYPIKTLVFDDNCPLYEQEVFPEQILQIGEVDDVGKSPEFDEEDLKEMDFCVRNMMESNPSPLTNFEIKNENILIGKNRKDKDKSDSLYCEIIPKTPKSSSKAVSLIFKFDKEIVGYPRILIEGKAGTVIDVIATEKFDNGRLNMDFMGSKRGFRLVLRGGKQFFEQWDWEGYLFMQVKIRELTAPMKIYKIASNVTHMRTRGKGEFSCNDEKLTKLYDVCAHTLLCCAIDGYLDCPSREQRSYLGDAYPEALVANTCFGEPRLTKKIIYDAAFGQRKDGITFSFHPGDYQIQCHIIPDYCFYWMQIAFDYYEWYGDEQMLYDLYPHFLRALEWFWKYIDPQTGLLGDNVPYWTFIDWSYGHDKPGFNAIINTQFLDVLQHIMKYMKPYLDLKTQKKIMKQISRLLIVIDNTFWDPKAGCYRDYVVYENGVKKFGEVISQHTNAYLTIKGITTPEKYPIILERIFIQPGEANDRLQIDDIRKKWNHHDAVKFDPKKNVLIAQPFFMHHVNKYFNMMNRFDLMFKYFRKGWVPMFEIGPTQTIWESWSQTGSECHAWCATPGYDLPVYILGIHPTEPGFKHFAISPNIADLEWAKGQVPTVIGIVHVEWKLLPSKDNMTKFCITFNVPVKGKCDFECPKLSYLFKKELVEVNMNGVPLTEIPEGSERIEFIIKNLEPAKYEIEVTYK